MPMQDLASLSLAKELLAKSVATKQSYVCHNTWITGSCIEGERCLPYIDSGNI